MIRRTTFCESPARGGSTTSTSGGPPSRPARAAPAARRRRRSGRCRSRWRGRCRSRRRSPSGTSSRPHTSATRGAIEQRRSCRSRSTGHRRARSRRARRTRSRARTAARPSRCWSGRTPRRRCSKRSPPSSSSKLLGARPAARSRHPGVVSPTPRLARPQQAVQAGRRPRPATSRSSSPCAGDQPDLELRRCAGPRGRRGCAAIPRRCGGHRRSGPAPGTSATTCSRAALAGSEASRQSVSSTISSQRPGA